jgi:FXSXX-COOH protein
MPELCQGRKLVESDTPPIRNGRVPDLRGIPLKQLANPPADAAGARDAVVTGMLDGKGSPSPRVSAFNSAI